MDKQLTEPAPAPFQLEEVYYTLFRHKWKIIACGFAGLVAAVILYKFQSPFFQSEAKLYVRYVVDRRAPTAATAELKSPDSQGETIMTGEVSILKSFDLAQKVAELVGPQKIISESGKGKVKEVSNVAAAGTIAAGLLVDAPKNSSVIAISFQHKDPEVVQLVLKNLIDAYKEKHVETHRAVGIMDDFLTQQADQFRSQVTQTEKELKALKSSVGVVSIDETEKAYSDQLSQIRQGLFSAEAQLAESQAAFSRFTNHVATKDSAPVPDLGIPPQKLDEYRRAVGHLDSFLKREQELLTQLTDKSPLVQEIRRQIDNAQSEKNRLETEEPRLLRSSVQAAMARAADLPGEDPTAEASKIYALEAKIKVLKAQLDRITDEATKVAEVEGKIRELQRKKELAEAQYKSYSSSLEQARLDEALGVANISVIQRPTPPVKDFQKLYKQMAYALVGGLVVGLAIAFLIEFFLDQTVRRPLQLEKTAPFPLLLNIPLLPASKSARAARNGQSEADSLSYEGRGPVGIPSEASVPDGRLEPYCDALRDRLIAHFQARNMSHKPKLVTLTGCLESAGVSTLAAGLAASLSEMADGNVLLVDMNGAEGRAYPFCGGTPSSDLDQVLETDRRIAARVQDNLYVVSTDTDKSSLFRVPPKRFGQLMPKLRASDYDYIIFDMPPLSQTSITGKLAGYMDLVLLVIESEKTTRNLLGRATGLLQESKVNVAMVLNKIRRYVPRWVHREYE
jgi:uncharacterized protein involved in exopolysaccharide biosynthesis/Mrp family chromosome partitioning ATPase